jgi:HlyD family secretion protein
MKQNKEKNRSLQFALIGTISVVVVLFIIGLYIYKPEPQVIQGEAEANEIRISGMVPGRVKHFYATEGNTVKAGDTLVILDSPELVAKKEQASAAEDAAMAQDRKARKGARQELITGAYEMWQKAEIGVDIAKKSYDRIQRLYDKGVISAQKRDEAESQYRAAVATAKAAKSQYDMAMNGADAEDKEAAQALVDRARGAVNEVNAYLDETILTSPSDGEISEVFPKVGELVGTGAPIMNVVNLDDIWFTFNVREDLLGDMKMGSTLTLKVPALGNETVEAKVTFIKALASYATWKTTKATGQFDAKTFEVRAKPVKKVKDLRPGMSAIIEKVVL